VKGEIEMARKKGIIPDEMPRVAPATRKARRVKNFLKTTRKKGIAIAPEG